MFGDFCRAFSQADLLVLTEIYAASEDPIPGVNGASLAQGVRQVSDTEVVFCPDLPHCLELLQDVLQSGDILLTLGAGNIWQLGEQFIRGQGVS
jgi:UDP-N-acetylmuramate--alanine ligase